jgi:hypothetical protein
VFCSKRALVGDARAATALGVGPGEQGGSRETHLGDGSGLKSSDTPALLLRCVTLCFINNVLLPCCTTAVVLCNIISCCYCATNFGVCLKPPAGAPCALLRERRSSQQPARAQQHGAVIFYRDPHQPERNKISARRRAFLQSATASSQLGRKSTAACASEAEGDSQCILESRHYKDDRNKSVSVSHDEG